MLIDVYAGRKDVVDFLYHLMEVRLAEGDTNISHVSIPTRAEHERFVAKKVYVAWYVVATNIGEMAGAVSITTKNELGVVLLPRFRRKGMAKEALIELMARHQPLHAVPSERPGRWVANIRAGNKASIALFESLGAQLFQHTYIL